MTDIYSGELYDMLPASLKSPETKSLSYALKMMTRWIIDRAATTHVPSVVRMLPEPVLDYLAQELRAPYYSDELPIETKRGIIDRTFEWFMTAGTPAAVEELISVVFGLGELIEWPDYEEPPYTPGTFDILTNATLTPDVVERFTSMVGRVKKESAHLRRVLIERNLPARWYLGVFALSEPSNVILNTFDAEYELERPLYVGAGIVARPRGAIDNCVPDRAAEAGGRFYAGGAVQDRPALAIDNAVKPRTVAVPAGFRVGAAARSSVASAIDNAVPAKVGVVDAGTYAGAAAETRPNAVITNEVPARSRDVRGKRRVGVAALGAPGLQIPNITKAGKASVKGAYYIGGAVTSRVCMSIGR